MLDQCKQSPDDRARDQPRIPFIKLVGDYRPVSVPAELIDPGSGTPAEVIGAYAIVMYWLERGQPATIERLAERLGCPAEHAEQLVATLHDVGALHYGEGPDAEPFRNPCCESSEPPPRRPIVLRDTTAPPEWRGPWPVVAGTATPGKGQNIAYVLRDGQPRPLYVGSTDDFLSRMESHAKTKVWTSWQAYLCDDRDGAYAFEQHLIRKLKPRLNRWDSLAESAWRRVSA